ncbi:MAG: purine-binding chemotaxis protein CheW [Gemmatimonadetes bacterium]|nr:purine-binding chemotaxis protein CheW [Gemmatimonadota bacterium]
MPRKKKTPAESADALAARALAEVEARAAAAHARELAEAEAAVEEVSEEAVVAEAASPAAIAARISGPRQAVAWDDDDEDDDDEEAYDDRWDDASYAHHRGPRRPLRERARSRSGVVELLMFRIGTERFAVELSSVEEAIDLPDVHHVPEMPPAMIGVITVRGALTPVFTPDDALGVRVEHRSAALIFRSPRGRFALAIDDVDDVMTLDLVQLRDAPGVDGSDPVVLGVARNEGSIVALVDAEALIEACQAIPVPELA